MLRNNFLEDFDELRILSEGVGRRRKFRGYAEGEVGVGWFRWEEGKNVGSILGEYVLH